SRPTRTTACACLTRARSCGRGWYSSASKPAGTRPVATTRSPPTASARLLRSGVGGDDGETLFGLRRRAARDQERDGESEVLPRRQDGGADVLPMSHPPARRPHLAVCQMLFGMTQWTCFSASEMAPTRQSIAALASP